MKLNRWQRLWLLAAFLYTLVIAFLVVTDGPPTQSDIIPIVATWLAPVLLTYVAGVLVAWVRRAFAQDHPNIAELRSFNSPQRFILAMTALTIALMLLYPPFEFQVSSGVTVNMGYAFILSPPTFKTSPAVCPIAATTLLLQWLAVLLIGGIAFLVFKDKA